jgi:DNA polymerase-3 subunit gamma/tau
LIVKHLKEISKKEKVSIDDEALAAIARGAEGGLRDAESALDQLIAFCGGKIGEKDVLSVFGLVAHEKIAALTNALIDGETDKALRTLKELDEVGKDLQRLLADVLDHFRNLLVVALGGDGGELLDLPETELALVKAQAQRIDADAVLRMIDALAGAEGRLRYALSKRILFEIALIKAIKARQTTGIDGVLKQLNELKNHFSGLPSGSSQPESRGATAPAKPSAVHEKPATHGMTAAPSASVEDAWHYAVEHLGKVTPLAKTYLIGARPLGLKGNVFTIGFDPQFAEHREFVDTARNRELLQAKLKEKLRTEVSLKFEVAEVPTAVVPRPARMTEASAPPPAKNPEDEKKNPEEFKNDPLIKKALEIFKGTVVEVRK